MSLWSSSLFPAQVNAEKERFSTALDNARQELLGVKQQIAEKHGPEHLFVIDSHLMILDDAMLTDETVRLIETELLNAEGALKRTLLQFKAFFDGIEDEYLRERSGDVETVVERILRHGRPQP